MKSEFKDYIEGKIKISSYLTLEEVSHWWKDSEPDEISYSRDKNQKLFYSLDTYAMWVGDFVIGYFLGHSKVFLEENNHVDKYEKVYCVDEFVVTGKDYEYADKLFNYMIERAKYEGCKAVYIETKEEFPLFYDFCINKGAKKDKEALYFEIQNVVFPKEYEHLKIYEGDKITIEDLYFLKDIGFNILRDVCIKEVSENEKIIIERKTGYVEYPSIVKKVIPSFNNFDKRIVSYINDSFITNNKSEIILNSTITSQGRKIEIPIIHDNVIILFTDDKIEIARYFMRNNEIKYIMSYFVSYDFEHRTISYSRGKRKIEDIIKKDRLHLVSKSDSLMDIKNVIDKVKDINDKINHLNSFEFEWKSEKHGFISFCMHFYLDNVIVEDNSLVKKEIALNQQEALKEIKKLYFGGWEKEYIENNGSFESWKIILNFKDNQKLEFIGKGKYPRIWFYVLDFINQYSNALKKEEIVTLKSEIAK